MSAGTAYGFTAHPDQHWSHQAACAQPDVNPDLFHTAPSRPDWIAVGRAIHICRHHCPVQEKCFREIGPMRSTIVGGFYFNDQAELSAYQPVGGFCGACREGIAA